MIKKSIFTFLCFFACINYTYTQQLVTDSNLSPQNLIDNLVGDACASASNIISEVNGSVNNITSFGSFNQGSSNFPLESGIVLSTGNVIRAGNSAIAENLSDGELNWETDADVLNILGIDQTLNATSIGFDLVSANNFVSFKYVFASDEYQQEYPCNFQDVFAILIRRAGTADPYVNIATIPDANTEVSTNTIHPDIAGFCDAQNEAFFQGYNPGSTNFNGHTKVLTANSPVIPGEVYQIKFVIADHIDQRFDSAVFIEAESFGGSIDLGEDQSICGNDLTLNATIDDPTAIYRWFLNDTQITGETSPILNVNQSGIYRAEVEIPLTGGSCILEDSVEIEIIPFQPAEPIENLSICDSEQSDGIFDFDFPFLMDDVIYNNLPSTNYNISYHLSQDDAENNTNPITGIYQNTESEETIFVRIESLDGSCLQIGSFNTIINIPPSTQNFDLEICIDQITDPGITDIIQFRSILADGNLDRAVTFYMTEEDAINQTNEIFDFPDFGEQPPFVVARVAIDGQPITCFSLAYLNFVYIGPPPLFTDRLILDACLDPNIEEFIGTTFHTYETYPVTFDIESYFETIETTIFPGSSVRTLELYGMGNPRSWTLTNSPSFTFRLAISFENGNCFSEIALEVHKNYLYNVIGPEKDINRCDDGSNDGILDFNFEEMNSEIIDGLDSEYASNLFIEYYATEEDRANGINEIDQSVDITVNDTETLFIRTYYVLNGIEACSLLSRVNLNINTALNLSPFQYDYCGNTDPITNSTNIIFEPISENIRNDIADTIDMIVSVEFYESEEDAENEINPLVNNYNLPEGQDLFVRVTNAFTGCYDVALVDLNITAALEASNPEPIIICDEDQDLLTTLDLTSVLANLSNGNAELDFTFHESFSDAIDEFHDFLAIPDPSNYTTTSKEIFIRAEIEAENCYTVFNFNILVYADPQLNNVPELISCEVNPNLPSSFIFEDQDLIILNNQDDMEVLYFETEAEATSNNNSIDKTVPYQNISNPQTVYVRLQNTSENACFKIAPMQIEVREAPNYNIPTDVFECDVNNNGLATTNLNTKIAEIEAGSTTDLNISFHLSPLNANLGTNEISLNYTASNNPQLIYARIENANSGCYAVETFNLNTFSLPELNPDQFLIACGNNFETNLTWDLSEIELQILDGRQFNIEFSYFNSEADAQADINRITNPTLYINNASPETVFAKVTNLTTGCFNTIPFELRINPAPQIIDFGTFEVCDNETNTVDLTEVNAVLLENTFNVDVSYHLNAIDAETNSNPLDFNFVYNNQTENLVARAEFTTTGCYAIYPFQIRVNPNPIATQPNNLVACDDDNDQLLEIDLSDQNEAILNGLNPNEYAITYYNSEADAIAKFQELDINYVAFNGEVIYVRLEDNSTGCFDVTSFSVEINPLPEINIEDQVLCLNDLPLLVSADTGNPTDNYLWSTNATTSDIEITEIGTYSVTITTQFGCELTTTFNVTESESATIDVVETIDFSDPNNITITVNGIGNYLYQLNGLPFQSSNVFSNVPIGYSTITIIDQNGCAQVTREVLVIDTPKHMTPNGDGDFDTWHITGVETLPGTIVEIFNRRGKLLKVLNHNSLGWDGTYNGNPLPADDYWYVAKVVQDGESFNISGHFALRR